ncbi:MAG: peptidoglycan-binding protein [Elainellaceae cyanobacterium]
MQNSINSGNFDLLDDVQISSQRTGNRHVRRILSLAVGVTVVGAASAAVAVPQNQSVSQNKVAQHEQTASETASEQELGQAGAIANPTNQSAPANTSPNASQADVSETSQAEDSQADTNNVLLSQITADVTLQLESTGEAVTALQQRLTDLGYYDGPITGYFGPLTEDAVMRFQAANGLTADGIVGASTTDALRGSSQSASSAADGLLQLDSTGEAVTALQTQLQNLGYYNGPVSGYFGPLTQAAVIDFQQANGLVADGIVGSSTETALQQSAQPTTASTSAPRDEDGLLEVGEVGTQVINIQRRLTELGYYDGAIDGDYGVLTEQAVTEFQRSQGLTADGVVGPNTIAALENPDIQSTSARQSADAVQPQSEPTARPSPQSQTQPNASSSPSPGSVSAAPSVSPAPFPAPNTSTSAQPIIAPAPTAGREAVMDVQRRLQARGFYSGPIDGVMGPETRQAIEAAHQAYEVDNADIGTDI